MPAYQYIYVMKDVSKTFPGGKEVLKHIWLSFFPGAKIGVLGPNGAGKSTLLKIMAGLDKEFQGEAWPAEGVSVGYLPQEPQLDPSKTVLENVMEGVAPTMALLKKFEEINMKFAEPDIDMDALLEEQAEVQAQIDAVNGWEIERTLEIAMDALRCPPADADVTKLSGGEKRRVALCRLLLSKPDMLLLDEPTANLDLAHQVSVLQVVAKVVSETSTDALLVIHDINLASAFCHNLLCLSCGNVAAAGKTASVLAKDLLEKVYGTGLCIGRHPLNGRPLVLPEI